MAFSAGNYYAVGAGAESAASAKCFRSERLAGRIIPVATAIITMVSRMLSWSASIPYPTGDRVEPI